MRVDSLATIGDLTSSHEETWDQNTIPPQANTTGQRMLWRLKNKIRTYRMQKFRGTSDARVSFAACAWRSALCIKAGTAETTP